MKRALWLIVALVIPWQEPTTATFEGTVVDSVTGQPIVGAHVTISSNLFGPPESARNTSPTPRRETPERPAPNPRLPDITNRDVFTDEQGRFTIADVPPVAYTLGTAAEGYVFQIYGQKTAYGALTPVTLVSGSPNRLVIRLDPAAEVTGSVVDQDRKPLSGATVFLLQTAYSPDEGGRPYVIGETQTDDAGKFSLKGVASGTYRLVAGIDRMPFPDRRQTQVNELYKWSFYPGVADPDLAATVQVLAGGHMDIGPLTLLKQEPRTIRGRIVDLRTGRPPVGARLSLIARFPVDRPGRSSEEPVLGRNSSYDPSTGLFEFRNLLSGRYRVDVALPPPPDAAPPRALATAMVALFNVPQDAFSLVDVSTTDVDDVRITVPGASTLRGKIVVSGEDPLSVFSGGSSARPQFTLDRTQSFQPSIGYIFLTSPDGTFEVHSPLDGRYRIALGPLRDNYYISEVRLNGVRAQDRTIELPPNSIAELVMTIRSDGGQIEGTILDDKNQPVTGARGIMLPDPQPEAMGLHYEVLSGPDGKFMLRGIAPGRYRIYVWEGLGYLELYDRELWRRTRPFATSVRVDAGSHITTNIRVITP